jgi:flavin-dependent dehydrogenase
MRDQARVVIIGGGIAGCSIAYHLARWGHPQRRNPIESGLQALGVVFGERVKAEVAADVLFDPKGERIRG